MDTNAIIDNQALFLLCACVLFIFGGQITYICMRRLCVAVRDRRKTHFEYVLMDVSIYLSGMMMSSVPTITGAVMLYHSGGYFLKKYEVLGLLDRVDVSNVLAFPAHFAW